MTQKTIINPLRICGIDVASGLRTCAHIKPASRDTGIQLEQRLNGRLVRTAVGLESALFAGRVGIKTPLGLVFGLEPLLSVLFAFSIDNLVIELESANFPELSGGASAFVFLLQSSGLRKQGGERVCVDANAPVTFSEQGRSIRYAPSAEGLRVAYLNHEDEELDGGVSNAVVHLSKSVFVTEICHGRLPTEQEKKTQNNWWIQRITRNFHILQLMADLALLNAKLNGVITFQSASRKLTFDMVSSLGIQEAADQSSDDMLKFNKRIFTQ